MATKRNTGNYSKLETQENQLDGKEYRQPTVLLPPERRSVVLTKKILRTIIIVSLFLFCCKITHFREKFLHDVRINRNFLGLFYISIAAFFVNYLWMSIALRWCKPKGKAVPVDNWDKAMPWQFYSATVGIVLAIISFIQCAGNTWQRIILIIRFDLKDLI